jgi:glycosyltransferase involved in cell wall biosynthesis
MVQALTGAYDVTLACWTPPDLDLVNRIYGTSIGADRVTILTLPRTVRAAIDAVPLPLALLKWGLLIRTVRRTTGKGDVLLSAENEVDFGRPGIQYVHYPRLLRPRPRADLRWYHRPKPLLDAYYAVCDWLSHFTGHGFRQNLTLANSSWTAARVRALDPELEAAVVPPPAAGGFPDVPWERRANGFLCIGRFSGEKEIEKVVAIVAAVRRDAPDVRLHLVGGGSGAYYRRIRRLARRHASWVTMHEALSRQALVELIVSQRYGIHGMKEEHFGIAPAEMVRGGCVVFVPNDGGQVDIVGGDDRLMYASADDAVRKIVAVLRDPAEAIALRRHLAGRKDLFSAERFMATIRRVVDAFDGGLTDPAA